MYQHMIIYNLQQNMVTVRSNSNFINIHSVSNSEKKFRKVISNESAVLIFYGCRRVCHATDSNIQNEEFSNHRNQLFSQLASNNEGRSKKSIRSIQKKINAQEAAR